MSRGGPCRIMTTAVNLTLQEKQSILATVLASKEFVRSPALAKLLQYLCQQSLQGKIHEIKELTIATDVYGKDLHFGEKRDSLVRVEVSRLRRRLQRYYETEGTQSRVRIVIKPGTYRPDFECLDESPASDTAVVEIGQEPVVAPAASPWKGWALYAAAGLVLLTAGWIIRNSVPKTTLAEPQKRPLLSAGSVPLPMSSAAPIRILAGSTIERSIDRFGAEWVGDRYYTGGDTTLHFGTQERSVLRTIIRWAPDQTPFRSFRYGNFSYRIPLAPGRYELRLYFAEIVFRQADSGDGVENKRVFDILLNNKPLLPFFDIAADAGGVDTADIRIFENVSPADDGFLHLEFRSIREAAWLNAIEILANQTGQAPPIRVVMRNANYTDSNGNLWGIDRFFFGGRQGAESATVSGTKDPELFTSSRYGNFSYHFPVPEGKYRLRLLFTETFFGPGNRGKGGVGSRVFNVYCGGIALLRQFDIFKEAGESRGLEKVFHNISPSPQGRIDLMFEPVVQYPDVRAIEIVPENPSGRL
jgi:Malectin domain